MSRRIILLLWAVILISSSIPPAYGHYELADKKTTARESKYLQKSLRNDCLRLRDGYDCSRDITGIAVEEGSAVEPYFFEVTMAHLRQNASRGSLYLYILLNIDGRGKTELPEGIAGTSDMGWNLIIKAFDDTCEIFDERGIVRKGAIKSIKFNRILSSIEVRLDKDLLREKGWKDGSTLRLQVFTTKDSASGMTDSIDLPHQKPWHRNGRLSAFMDVKNPCAPPTVREENWGESIIYFILTDRFKDGMILNNQDVDRRGKNRFHGGDLQGIIDSLDYLAGRNITAIWISPPMRSQREFMKSAGYHGYWPIDFYAIDPHQGTMEKLRELLQEAHRRGLKVLLDLPLNHTAWEHPWVKDPTRRQWFHHNGTIRNWDDDKCVEEGDMYGLPDLAQENPEVYSELLKISRYWIDTGIDGFRLDAVRHIPRDFWKRFEEDVHHYAGPDFFLVGEYFHGWDRKLAPYQSDGMDSLFDMPLMYTMSEVFAKNGSMIKLAEQIAEEERIYENPAMMSAFLDNQDQPRFITQAEANGKEKLMLALAFLMTVNRIPVIYYGTEAAMEGNHDIMQDDMANRKDMEFGGDPALMAYCDRLSGLRRNSPALKNGALIEMWKDDKIYCFSRMSADDEVIVILNNDGNECYREIPLRPESEIRNGTLLIDAMTGAKHRVERGEIKLRIAGKQPIILTRSLIALSLIGRGR
jgi:glycosidase